MHQRERLEVLEGLRGLAVVLVVAFHLWQKSWWNPLESLGGLECLPRRGYLGVELFFFLSGFCLYWPVACTGRAPQLRSYLTRRALKILPSYLLCLLAALWLLPEAAVQAQPWLHLLAHLSFLHTLIFATYYSIQGVFWSLGVEVCFYAFFPALATLLVRRPVRGPLWGGIVLAAGSFFYQRWALQSGAVGVELTMRVNQLPGFLELFGGGMVAAALAVKARAHLRPHIGWGLLVLVGLALLLGLFRSFEGKPTEHDGELVHQVALRLPLALVLVLITLAGVLTPLRAPWPLKFLATISYNLYLWHALLATLLQEALGITEPWKVTDSGLRVRFTLIAWGLSLVVASVLTYGFELPLLRRGRAREQKAPPAEEPGG